MLAVPNSVGKWGQAHRKGLTDRRLREVVEECVELPGYECFKLQVPRRGVRGEGRTVWGPQRLREEGLGFRFYIQILPRLRGALIAAGRLAEFGPVTGVQARREERARGR